MKNGTKIQIVLTPEETKALRAYGLQFGYNLNKTIHFLISRTVEEVILEKITLRENELKEDTY